MSLEAPGQRRGWRLRLSWSDASAYLLRLVHLAMMGVEEMNAGGRRESKEIGWGGKMDGDPLSCYWRTT